jgi:heterodisulfide reductase subunit B2
VINVPAGDNDAAANVINAAAQAGIETLATSCPLCEYNLGKQQDQFIAKGKITANVPTFYFTQLLAMALGVNPEVCHFELNDVKAMQLLETKNIQVAA